MPEITVKGLPALILAFVGALVITRLFIPRVIKVVNERKLTDKPGKHKIHTEEIPTLGGIAIFGGFAFGFLLGIDGHMQGASYIIAAALMLFFTGLKDDLVNLKPWQKITSEIGTAFIIVFFTNLRFTDLHGFLGISTIPAWSSYILTIFLVLLIINAFNLIDGIDGLAASIGIISSIVFGIWFLLAGDYGYAIMAAALLGTLFVFIRFNMSNGPMKIFMGDSGSLVIGFILAIFAIHFNEMNADGLGIFHLQSSPTISIAILIVPLFDTLRVFILRIYLGRNPFLADNIHIHHMMLRAGFSHRMATLFMSIVNIAIIVLAFLLDHLGILWLGLLLLIICLSLALLLTIVVKRKEAGSEKDKILA